MENEEKELTRYQQYYREHKVQICKGVLRNAEKKIQEIHETHAAVLATYYTQFPFSEYEPFAICVMKSKGIFEQKREYADCLSVSSIAYLYSVSQCAYRGYKGKHVRGIHQEADTDLYQLSVNRL